MSRVTGAVWVLLLVGATVAAIQIIPSPDSGWCIPVVVALWLVTAAALIPSPLRSLVGVPLRWRHDHPILYWAALLVYIVGALVIWIVPSQPTNGRLLTPIEFTYLGVAAWGLLYLAAYDLHEADLRAMGAALGKSKLTSVMVTITTLVIILIGGEGYLRIFYITTDGYGFTAMNYWWYENYGWAHLNSLGFRDYEPLPDAPALTRIGVLGDSFAMGHGINNIDDTFPQLLEKMLGAGYDVDLIAKSGWDSDTELFELESYPLRPNIVVLSYYLNDIDYLLEDPSVNPNSNFAFPQSEALAWYIRTFFLPNYIYYNLLQFTSSQRASSFAYDLIGAHLDDALWDKQVPRLYEMVAWAQNHNVRLIVLVWPQLAEVEASTPATARVRDFFVSQGVQVVDMTDVLRGRSVGEITVNRFDSHPNAEAHRLAAEQLYHAIVDEGQGS
ncbi:MAG: SGNH/GDSL hydrolase family protein [Anaerolineae bacterium]